MPADQARVWEWIADERVRLAELLEGVGDRDWDRPSLCTGWRVRDVLGHVVWLAEGTRWTILGDLIRTRRLPNAAVAQASRSVGDLPPADLVARLRRAANGRFKVPGAPPAAVLGEVLVHRADITVPLGLAEYPPDQRVRTVLETYRWLAPVVRGTWWGPALKLVATDGGWSVGRGREVRGTAQSLLLALAGRPLSRDMLSGPGATALIRRRTQALRRRSKPNAPAPPTRNP